MTRTVFATIIVALSVLANMNEPSNPTILQPPGLHPQNQPTGSLILYPTADTWVNYNLPNNNYGSGVYLKIGSEECAGQEFPDRGRALIKFDLSPIPTGQVIESASLRLYLRNAYPGGATINTISIHGVTASWIETGVTWNNQPAHTATSFASIVVGVTQAWYSWDITELVREWYSGSRPNNGLKMISVAETTCNMRYFDSRENVYDPRLEITYKPQYRIYLPLIFKAP
ncbi:MAG: DNRLRE domain-containing protein, partial [Chloroflexota bacterium]